MLSIEALRRRCGAVAVVPAPVASSRYGLIGRLGGRALAVLVFAVTLASAAPATAAPLAHTVVALGDSVPAGSACGRCRAFPVAYGHLLAVRTRGLVRVVNDARGGETSASELGRLRDTGVQRDVRKAGTVLIMVGANDYAPAFQAVRRGSCRGADCYDAVRRRVRTNVASLVRKVRALHRGGVVHVVVIGYWNVVQDGRVGLRNYGPSGLAQARAATQDANVALRGVAHSAGATYVSTRLALRGSHDQVDPTAFLAADGDHPNGKGHELIAAAIFGAAPTG